MFFSRISVGEKRLLEAVESGLERAVEDEVADAKDHAADERGVVLLVEDDAFPRELLERREELLIERVAQRHRRGDLGAEQAFLRVVHLTEQRRDLWEQ